MKKIMSLMLGLSLVLGSVAFAEDKKADTSTAPKKEKKAKKEKKTKDSHLLPPALLRSNFSRVRDSDAARQAPCGVRIFRSTLRAHNPIPPIQPQREQPTDEHMAERIEK